MNNPHGRCSCNEVSPADWRAWPGLRRPFLTQEAVSQSPLSLDERDRDGKALEGVSGLSGVFQPASPETWTTYSTVRELGQQLMSPCQAQDSAHLAVKQAVTHWEFLGLKTPQNLASFFRKSSLNPSVPLFGTKTTKHVPKISGQCHIYIYIYI